MPVSFDFADRVAIVTGACGALGSAVADRFADAGATVCAVDLIAPDSDDSLLDESAYESFYEADLTMEESVESTVESVIDDHGRVDYLCNVAGTWRGGTPIEDTDLETFDLLMGVNLKSAFLTSKHALPHLGETDGAIVSVSARSSLEGGEGDGPYRISKAGIRLLTETIAEENLGSVRANCVMPSMIDTPTNREMMEPKDEWVDPTDIADVMLFLCSDAAGVISGAAVPVYGEA
ncbi:MAG: NAD(P)-dependent dehydrogenase (short-subunit alcohol dehydrogenase family) [Halobacteriales archaeon]|jgi:NAD(P)-dependent dehydrogenase (short-subunit alcohol dehydrogenase family)